MYITRLIEKNNVNEGECKMNGQQELDDLIMAAAQKDNDAAVAQLVKAVQAAELKLLKDSAGNFELLFDAWDESVYKSEDKATV